MACMQAQMAGQNINVDDLRTAVHDAVSGSSASAAEVAAALALGSRDIPASTPLANIPCGYIQLTYNAANPNSLATASPQPLMVGGGASEQ
jgi:glutamate synthase domain-containing protein 2